MTKSKELVKKAIEFNNPERIPYSFDCWRTPVKKEFGDDFVWVGIDPDPDFIPKINTCQERENEWGVIYQALGKTIGEPKVFPLADVSKVDTYKIPDFCNPARYKSIEKAVKEKSDKYILGGCPHLLFQRMMDLFGFENLMIQLVEEQDRIEHMADRMMESCINIVHCMADRGVDGIIVFEDLGLQDRPIISPDMWRGIFKARTARIIKEAHNRGLHVIMHSCGYITDIIEDLIEIGLDVIQLDQQDNMGIDALAEKYAGRICFFCPVDIQTTMTCGSFTEIERKVKRLILAFGEKNGGFIAKLYPQPEAIGITEEYMEFICEAFKKYGRYPLSEE